MPVKVQPADIDEQNHVNNTVYLRWVQDVATAHWRSLASAEAQSAIGWVVLRHEIDYRTPASLDDELILRTWVGAASRLKFERFTEIRRKIDNEVLSQARTLWVPIDVRTGKPTRVSADVRARFST
ncbi:MAG TPA: thioesterase family protein [Chthoniobacterales bacterium]|jgi:acyl-CoA thioester hydrolase|nr:thioesterase family protein [Chthoniobacterales bacterium]